MSRRSSGWYSSWTSQRVQGHGDNAGPSYDYYQHSHWDPTVEQWTPVEQQWRPTDGWGQTFVAGAEYEEEVSEAEFGSEHSIEVIDLDDEEAADTGKGKGKAKIAAPPESKSKSRSKSKARSKSKLEPEASSSRAKPGSSSKSKARSKSKLEPEASSSKSRSQPGASSSRTTPGSSSKSQSQPGASSSRAKPGSSSKSRSQPEASSSRTTPGSSSKSKARAEEDVLSVKRKDIRDKFTLVQTLAKPDVKGKGTMNGGVYVVRRRSDGKVMVEKRPTREAIKYLCCEEEFHLLKDLKHACIVKFYDAFIQSDRSRSLYRASVYEASLYMEYCDLGDLAGVIRSYRRYNGAHRQPKIIPEMFIWQVFASICSALAYLHDGCAGTRGNWLTGLNWKRVLHRDLKLDNIFLKSPNDPAFPYPSVLLGDFGLATRQGSPLGDNNDFVGDPVFQGPELPYEDPHGRSDVWSMGAVVQALCHLDSGPVSQDPPPGWRRADWVRLPGARRPRSAGSCYTGRLTEALSYALAWKFSDRILARHLGPLIENLARGLNQNDEELEQWAFDG